MPKTIKDLLFIFLASILFAGGMHAVDPGLDVVQKNDFTTTRNLREYDELCQKKLRPSLNELSKRALYEPVRVLDSGCGAAVALREAAGIFKDIKFTGICYKMDEFLKKEILSIPNVEIFSGRFIQGIKNDEILSKGAKFNCIIDIFGPYSYSPEPKVILQKYFDMLASDGVIFISAINPCRKEKRERGLKVIDSKTNLAIDLLLWLKDNTTNLSIEIGLVKEWHECVILKALDPTKPITITGDLTIDFNYDFYYPPVRDFKEPNSHKSKL